MAMKSWCCRKWLNLGYGISRMFEDPRFLYTCESSGTASFSHEGVSSMTTKCQMFTDYRLIWLIALSIHSFAYCWCAHSRCEGMTGFDLSSTFPSPWKRMLLRRNSAKPRSKSVVAVISNSPSDGRCPSGELSGESPHRTSIDVGVFSSTTKWSVISVPLSYVELKRAGRSHSWWAVVVLLRYLFWR